MFNKCGSLSISCKKDDKFISYYFDLQSVDDWVQCRGHNMKQDVEQLPVVR